MPTTRVIFYRDGTGTAPVIAWLDELDRQNPDGATKCLERIELLAGMGHELRRPVADILRDGIYELRASHRRVQYRILYFFHGRNIAIIAHAIVKEGSEVPDIDIDRAIERKQLFINDPDTHTYEQEIPDGEN